jgi:hypothetical protein
MSTPGLAVTAFSERVNIGGGYDRGKARALGAQGAGGASHSEYETTRFRAGSLLEEGMLQAKEGRNILVAVSEKQRFERAYRDVCPRPQAELDA